MTAMTKEAVEVIREIVAEVDAFYPREVWPDATDEQIASLHEWARAAHGLGDGSRFHVGGIRHALRLVQQLADDLLREEAGGDQS